MYQRSNRRWSHVDDITSPTPIANTATATTAIPVTTTATPVAMVHAQQPVSRVPATATTGRPSSTSPSGVEHPNNLQNDGRHRSSPHGKSEGSDGRRRHRALEQADSDASEGSPVGRQGSPFRRSASDRLKEARSFFGRLGGSLREKKGRGGGGGRGSPRSLDISSPVLVDSPHVRRKMAQLGCYDLHPSAGTTAAISEGHLASLNSPLVSASTRATARSISPISSPPTASDRVPTAGHSNAYCNKSSQAKVNNNDLAFVDTKAFDGGSGNIPLEHRLSIYDNLPTSSAEHCADLVAAVMLPTDVAKQRSMPQLAAVHDSNLWGEGRVPTLSTAVKSSSTPAVDFVDNLSSSAPSQTTVAATNGLGNRHNPDTGHYTYVDIPVRADLNSLPANGGNTMTKLLPSSGGHNFNATSKVPIASSVTSSADSCTTHSTSTVYVSAPQSCGNNASSAPLTTAAGGKAKGATNTHQSDLDPRRELDMVLQELLNNIGDLNLHFTVTGQFACCVIHCWVMYVIAI